ncbi:MAG TPA: hypothetical protein VES91_07660 [Burkholderiaceae bacterium]|nr:hypothetical protein [Burkholderiaceae bacterium]
MARAAPQQHDVDHGIRPVSEGETIMRHNSTNKFLKSAAGLAAASTLALFLAACAEEARIDVGAAEPDKSVSERRTFEPALNSLDGVTHHG